MITRAIVVSCWACVASAQQHVIPAGCSSLGLQEDAAALLQLEKPSFAKHAPVLVQTTAEVFKEISDVAGNSEETLNQATKAVDGTRSEIAVVPENNVSEHTGDEKFGVDKVTEALGDISDTVSVVDNEFGAEEYIGKMQGLVRDFSNQARSRAARAQAGLEAQVGEADKAFIISAAATIVETGEVAENMAEQFSEQVQVGRDEVAEVLTSLESKNVTDESAISERLQPSVDFLVELLGGTTQLMGSTLEVLRATQRHTHPSPKDKARHMASFMRVPGDLASVARQSLHDADATLAMMSTFAERLRISVQKTSNLGDRFIDASGDSALPLQRDLVVASRQVSNLLSADFVAEESARRLAGGRSSASRLLATAFWASLVMTTLTV